MEKTCPNCWLDFEKNGAWSRLLDNDGYCPRCGERMSATALYCEVMGRVSHARSCQRVYSRAFQIVTERGGLN